MRGKEWRKRLKLATFDVNFEDIDKSVTYWWEYELVFALRRDWRMSARTVELHERIERPMLGIIALFMLVGPA